MSPYGILNPTICWLIGALTFLGAELSQVFHAAEAKKKEIPPYCLLMGSCFNEKGLSLPGVDILVERKQDPAIKGKKKWELVSSPRGEFAVRLPAGKCAFMVAAKKKGYQPMQKVVEFTYDERQDIIFNMTLIADEKQ
jgi:hypothetical protein